MSPGPSNGTVTVSRMTLALVCLVAMLCIVIAVLATVLVTNDRGQSASPARADSAGGATTTHATEAAPPPTETPTQLPPTPTPSPAPPTRTPTVLPITLFNGYELQRSGSTGESTLTVTNGTSQDALVRLVVASTGETARLVHVGRQNGWTIEGIAPGSYLLQFALGTDWDTVLARFQRNTSFKEFEDPFDFTVSGGFVTTWEVTLNAVPGGRAQTDTISADEFYGD